MPRDDVSDMRAAIRRDGAVIEVSPVRLPAEAERLVTEVLRSGRLAQGPTVEAFEAALRELVGTAHVISVSSGTAALSASLEAIGVGAGDEVVTSPFTFVATINAIVRTGAAVRFADIDPVDFNVDADAVAAAVTKRSAVLLPVHLYGHPAPMDRLAATAAGHGLALVEDAAQALGASFDGAACGSFGVGCFSFYASKTLTTGEGGLISTDDDRLAERVQLLRNQGMRRRYVHELVGSNMRMTELQAAVGLSQLPAFAEMTSRRRANAASLSAGLAGIPGVVLPTAKPGCNHAYQHYTVRVDSEARLSRDGLQTQLAATGVETAVYYPRPVYDQPCFAELPLVPREPMPEAERAAAEVLSLPVHPWLTPADLTTIVETVRRLLDA